MKINNLTIYAVAGLLHDIGKFGQRADVSVEKSTLLSQQDKNLASQICNTTQGGWYSHQHVIWTASFIEKYIEKFKKVGLVDGSENVNNLSNLAAYHHRPSSPEQRIITLADWWSSGLDRNDQIGIDYNEEWKKDKFRSVPSASLFNNLNGYKTDRTLGYPAQKFNTGETIFPKPTDELDNKPLYGKLWKQFENDFEKLPDRDTNSFIFSLYHLLKLYTWYIPASTMEYPDISLFEHLKTTGAFAYCIAAYLKENPEAVKSDNNYKLVIEKGHYPIQLVCGDISGIQSFIYNISNKSAVKSLKGRSLYVQLLAETIAQELLEESGASVINMVYAAGGKFYILLPNTQAANNAIVQYKENLEKNLWDRHKGMISVNIASIAFSMQPDNRKLKVVTTENPSAQNVGDLWFQLSQKTAEQKKKKFQSVLLNQFDLFEPYGTGGNVDVCSVTGEEIIASKELKLDPLDAEQNNEEVLYVSAAVKEQIKLGKSLANHQYLAQMRIEGNDSIKVGLNSHWQLISGLKDIEQNQVKKLILSDWDTEIDLVPNQYPVNSNALGFRLYGGSRVAIYKSEHRNKTFEEIAGVIEGEEKESFTRLAVLRMDIDNLGSLFMKGFEVLDNKGLKENKASFSALATLSTQLDLFFSGYLNTLRNADKYKDRVNIVYSGGDDLFAVGRWSEIIAFAIEIKESFQKFVSGRTDISLSGGIVLVNPKFPIAKASDLAGDAEDKAKKHRILIDEIRYDKNAITLFDIPLNWQYEMPFVQECKNDLVQWIGRDKCISKGLLMKIFSWYEIYKQKKPDWRWQSSYTLARMAADNKNNPGLWEKLEQLKTLMYFGQYNKGKYNNINFNTFIAACRWAELELRNLSIL